MWLKYWSEFEDIIREYDINYDDVCIVGSGVLTNAGYRENHDFDFTIRSSARDKLIQNHNELTILPTGTICFNENVQILLDRYGEVGVSDEMLFEDNFSLIKGGIRYASIEVEIAKKIKRYAPKDKIDLDFIGESDHSRDYDWLKIYKMAYINDAIYGNECKPEINPCKKIKLFVKKSLVYLVTEINRSVQRINHSGEIKQEMACYFDMKATSPLILLERAYRNKRYKLIISTMHLNGFIDLKNNEKLLTNLYDIDVEKLEMTFKQFSENKHVGQLVINIDEKGCVIDKHYELATIIALGFQSVFIRQQELPSVESELKVSCVDEELEELIIRFLCRNGIFFCGILWGSVHEFYNDICEEISSKYKLIGIQEIDINGRLEAFIEQIYGIDNVDNWKLRIKQQALQKYCQNIRVVYFDVAEPRFRDNIRTGAWLSDSVASFKNKIREKYAPRIKNYVSDIIIHVGDNYEINRNMFEIIDKFKN